MVINDVFFARNKTTRIDQLHTGVVVVVVGSGFDTQVGRKGYLTCLSLTCELCNLQQQSENTLLLEGPLNDFLFSKAAAK